MSNIIDIKNYTPTSQDQFFFDNNIWMFLFCPIGNYSRNDQLLYSRFLQSVQTARATIFINSLILSEFSNSFLRIDFEQWKKEKKFYNASYKKDYISSVRYSETSSAIVSAIKNILSLSEKRPDDFHMVSIDSICKNFNKIDFNDCYLIEFCKNNFLKLVTDDNDFIKITDSNLEILTKIN